MTRGGRSKERDGPERRCIVTGESGPTQGLIRFAVGPGGEVVPDLAEKLPGRGIWLSSTRAAADEAVKRRAFARAARRQVTVPENLSAILEDLLARRAVDSVALARKAGLAVTGFEKVKARLKQGPVGALVQASDGSPQGFAKLLPLAGDVPVVDRLESGELGLAFGRDYVIHAALEAGGATARVLREVLRLSGFRSSGEAPRWNDDTAPFPGDSPDGEGGDAAVGRPDTGR